MYFQGSDEGTEPSAGSPWPFSLPALSINRVLVNVVSKTWRNIGKEHLHLKFVRGEYIQGTSKERGDFIDFLLHIIVGIDEG